jgi:hypothetical protein
MLAFAIVSLPAVSPWLIWLQPGMMGPMLTADPGLDWGAIATAVGAALWVAGVIWMIRIFRGPSDDPPPWRYRDH